MNADTIEDAVIRRVSQLPPSTRPRLRFDKVARRFLSSVQKDLSDHVPDGLTILFAIAAPIRVASKAAVELENAIRTHLANGYSSADVCERIEENSILLRIIKSRKGTPRVVGFVYTPHSGAAKQVLDTAQAAMSV